MFAESQLQTAYFSAPTTFTPVWICQSTRDRSFITVSHLRCGSNLSYQRFRAAGRAVIHSWTLLAHIGSLGTRWCWDFQRLKVLEADIRPISIVVRMTKLDSDSHGAGKRYRERASAVACAKVDAKACCISRPCPGFINCQVACTSRVTAVSVMIQNYQEDYNSFTLYANSIWVRLCTWYFIAT